MSKASQRGGWPTDISGEAKRTSRKRQYSLARGLGRGYGQKIHPSIHHGLWGMGYDSDSPAQRQHPRVPGILHPTRLSEDLRLFGSLSAGNDLGVSRFRVHLTFLDFCE